VASGASAANSSGAHSAPPITRNVSAIAISARAPHIHINVSNVRLKPGFTSCSCPPCDTRPGSANIGSAPGGILELEVPVRDVTVRDLVAVPLVHRRIDDLPVRVEAVVQRRPRADEHGDGRERREGDLAVRPLLVDHWR
jgi:hypothetical protein